MNGRLLPSEYENLLLELSRLQREHAARVRLRSATLFRRASFLRALGGPSRADREDAEFGVRMAAGAEQYRQNHLREGVRGAAYQLSCRIPTTEDGGSRFWLDHVIDRAGEVLDGLYLAELARELAGVTEVHVAEALREIDGEYRRRAHASLRYTPAIEGGTGRDGFHWIALDGDRTGDTFVRWTAEGDEGLVGKIAVTDLLRGLGVARRMLEQMIELHPEVDRWTTTARTRHGAKLFAAIKVRYPEYCWD